MTLEETAEMMAILRAAYPRFYVNMSQADAMAAVKLWHGFFSDDDKDAVNDAIKAFIANDVKGFPPVIGQIREKLDLMNQAVRGFELTPQAAWALVKRAMKDSAYHSAEQFDKLPEVVREVIGSPTQLHEWAVSNDGVSESVIASNFQRSYAAHAENHRELRRLPTSLRLKIEEDKMRLNGGTPQFALDSGENKEMDAYAAKLRAMTDGERKAYFKSLAINFDAEE